jgi:hypothetical protein
MYFPVRDVATVVVAAYLAKTGQAIGAADKGQRALLGFFRAGGDADVEFDFSMVADAFVEGAMASGEAA